MPSKTAGRCRTPLDGWNPTPHPTDIGGCMSFCLGKFGRTTNTCTISSRERSSYSWSNSAPDPDGPRLRMTRTLWFSFTAARRGMTAKGNEKRAKPSEALGHLLFGPLSHRGAAEFSIQACEERKGSINRRPVLVRPRYVCGVRGLGTSTGRGRHVADRRAAQSFDRKSQLLR